MEPHTPTPKPLEILLSRKWSFLAIAVLVFVASYGILTSFDLIPNAAEVAGAKADVVAGPVTQADVLVPSEFPTKVTIPSIDLETTISNPTTAAPALLDELLLKGAVRYPTSGLLGTKGSNVVVFGHSSYLPIVHNQAYKAFDGIQKLSAGDKIYVSGTNRAYVYAVETVAQADATKAGVPLAVEGNKLTLITCDSFATKSDRYVVIAHLVESYPIAK